MKLLMNTASIIVMAAGVCFLGEELGFGPGIGIGLGLIMWGLMVIEI